MPETLSPLISKPRASGSALMVYQSAALLFNLSLVLFITASVSWGGLFFYRRSLDSTRKGWDSKIAEEEERFNAEGGVGRLVETSNALNAAKELITNHVFASNVLAFLEETTHQRVQFSKMSFVRDTRRIDLSGIGASYRTVAEQVSILEGNSHVERVEFGGLSLSSKGTVDFKLAIVFKPSLLELRERSAPGPGGGTPPPSGAGD